MCGSGLEVGILDENNMVNTSFYEELPQLGRRSKRQVDPMPLKNRCPVKLVADYLFFEKIGNSKTALAARYLVRLLAKKSKEEQTE